MSMDWVMIIWSVAVYMYLMARLIDAERRIEWLELLIDLDVTTTWECGMEEGNDAEEE